MVIKCFGSCRWEEAKFRANDAWDVSWGDTAFLDFQIMEQVVICQLQNLNTEFILMI
jgi:hypothetical protein